MVSNSSTINKTNNYHSPQTIEHKKDDDIYVGNKRQRIPKGQSKKGNNLEKLATKGTQDEEKQNKNITQMYWTPLCANKHT